MVNNILRKKSLTGFIFFFIVCVLQTQLYAQRTTPGTAPGTPAGSTALSDIDTINYYTGRLNVSIPITNYGGRGEAQLPMSIQLEQTSWTQTYIIQQPSGNYLFYPERKDKYGNSTIFSNVYSGVPSMETLQLWYDSYDCPGGTQWAQKTLTLLQFTAPNGTKYDLRDQNHGGRYNEVGYCGQTWGNHWNRGTVFTTSDGSSATFISDQQVSDDLFAYKSNTLQQPTGYLHLRDGMTYRFENGQFIWMRDRNGNLISLVTTNNNGVISTKLVDSLNREISSPSYKGFGGSVRNVAVQGGLLENSLRSGQTLKSHQQLFPQYSFTGEVIYNPGVISKIVLPNNQEYKLFYNSYGDIARIELPTGAAIEYDWLGSDETGSNEGGCNCGDSGVIHRRVVERRLYADGSTLTQKMVIGRVNSSSLNVDVTVDIYGPTLLINRTKHFYYGNPLNSPNPYTYGFYSPWQEGKEYQTQVYAEDGTTLLRQTNQTWAQRAAVSWYTGSADTAPPNDPRVIESTTLLADSNQVSRKTFNYDNFNNLTDTYEYDYGIGTSEQFLRRSHTDYLTTNSVNNTDYTGNSVHILNLPSQTWVSSDTSGNAIVSRTKYEYDNYATDTNHAGLLDRLSISGHDSNFGTSFVNRGNTTKITSYSDAQNQGGAVSVYSQYDIAGNPVKAIDARGYSSTISYTDNFGAPDGNARVNTAPSPLGGLQTFAFPTSATNPAGYTGYSQVDYYTGSVVDSEDLNGNVSTTYSTNDPLDRPTQAVAFINRPSLKRQTTVVYDDVNRKVTITSDSKSYGDNLIKGESYYDKMGRTTETRAYETGTNYIATVHQYDALGRAYKSSNPYRPYLNEQPQYTTASFDALSRTYQIQTPDNAVVSRSYLGSTTTVTDQALRKRSGTTDAIGRLTNVAEDPTGVNYQTTYLYDVLGRLRKTTQIQGQTTQNRYFMYNDLGRLIRAKQPEQIVNANLAMTDPVSGNTNWSVSYEYDNNGNVTSTTDANNKNITGVYDNLNRLTNRNYFDGTPSVTFTFDDQNVANSKGQLTAVTSTASATYFTVFDQLGRVKSSSQVTDNQTYSFPDYTYDLSGALVSETYPSQRVVTTETDSIGRLSRIASQFPNQAQRTYLSNLSYTSFGAVSGAKLGNGRWESAQFDQQRLQLKQIGLGASAGDTSLLKLEYGYGTTDNNGGLRQQKITVPGMSNQIVQSYTYDSLNRLQSATETPNGSQTTNWKQTFSYDRFGNRRFDANNTTTLLANNATYNPNIDQATNRFLVSEGYNYDNEGNLLGNPEYQLFSYDAENHQKQVQDNATQVTTNYYYDGLGKRVRKDVGNQETIFVYDAFGKLVAEYTTNQTITSNGTQYLTTDALGSPRASTNAIGQVASRHDYLPFGEELTSSIGGRTPAQGYGQSDNARQKFTGYERDSESGLDYAQARYYSSKHGRFTSVDPLGASASIKNPQTFNRYSYGLNSPYKYTDSLGLKSQCPGMGSGAVTLGDCDGTESNGVDDCPPVCPKTGPLIVGGNGLGALVTVDIIIPVSAPIIETVAPYLGGQIIARALEALPVLSTQILAVPATIVTVTRPQMGSPCQYETGDDFCRDRKYQPETESPGEPFPVPPTATGTPRPPGMFRGGPSLAPNAGEVKIRDGLVQSLRGVSVNTNPRDPNILKYGGPYRLGPLPEGLMFNQFGKDPGHYEIIPTSPITFADYAERLSRVTLTPEPLQ